MLVMNRSLRPHIVECWPEGREVTFALLLDEPDRGGTMADPHGIDLVDCRKKPDVMLGDDKKPVATLLWIRPSVSRIPQLVLRARFVRDPRADRLLEAHASGHPPMWNLKLMAIDSSPPTPKEIDLFPSWDEARILCRASALLSISIGDAAE